MGICIALWCEVVHCIHQPNGHCSCLTFTSQFQAQFQFGFQFEVLFSISSGELGAVRGVCLSSNFTRGDGTILGGARFICNKRNSTARPKTRTNGSYCGQNSRLDPKSRLDIWINGGWCHLDLHKDKHTWKCSALCKIHKLFVEDTFPLVYLTESTLFWRCHDF